MPQFMVFVFPPNTEEGFTPNVADVQKMSAYNEELIKAGVMVDGNGLTRDKSARLDWADGRVGVTDGPFAEVKELVGGYWVFECKTLEEAVEWARRAPMNDGDMLEVRKIAGAEDFPPEVWEAAEQG